LGPLSGIADIERLAERAQSVAKDPEETLNKTKAALVLSAAFLITPALIVG
jgi:hypothetical protein